MLRITDVVKHLLILNIFMFVVFQILFPQFYGYLALYYPASELFQPFQLVSHMFMHSSVSHLLFNMIGLFFLGPIIEQHMGPKRFLFFYLACGFGSMLLSLLFTFVGFTPPYALVGASGAIMGISAAILMHYPNMMLSLIFPPISFQAKYLIMFIIAIDLFAGFGRHETGVAHFAHLGGLFMGFALILYWEKFGSKP